MNQPFALLVSVPATNSPTAVSRFISHSSTHASDQGFLDPMQPSVSSTPAAYRVGVEQFSNVVPIVA